MPTSRLTVDEFALLTHQPILTPDGFFISIAERVEKYAGQVFGLIVADYQTLGIYAFTTAFVTAGAYTDVEEGMTVDFGTTPGARDIGSARIRTVPLSNLMFINEIAPAKLKLADGIYFSVRDEFTPHLVLPLGRGSAVGTSYTNTITMYKDYGLAYTDQNQLFTPKANITRSATARQAPKPAGWVDGYHSAAPLAYRTLVLSSALSFSLSGTITGRAWNVKDCTIISGTSTSTTITIRIPVGFRNIRLTVTSSDGKVGTRVFPLWAHDNSYRPLSRFQIPRNWTGEWREIEADFFQQDTSEVTIPRGSTACFWEDNFTSGIGSIDSYREQMYGWVKEETALFRKHQPRSTLTITGLGEWLDRYRAIPQRVYDPITRASNSWFEMESIYLDKLVFFMFENFSNANLIANLFLSGVTDNLKSLDITGQSLFDQVRFIVQGFYGKARCKSLNDLWSENNYQYLTAAQRAGIDSVMDLTPAHWLDTDGPKIARRNYDVVANVLGAGAGFDGSTNTIYNARAPGRTPSDSNTEQDAPGQNLPAASSQDVLQQLTGAHFLVLNNDRDSVPVNVLYNLDCVEPGDLITVTDPDSTSDIVLDGDKFLIKEINISYEDRYTGRGKKVVFTLEGVIGPTTKDDAQFVEVLVDTTDPVDYTPPEEIQVVPVPLATLPLYDGTDLVPTKLIAFDADAAHCHIATAFNPILTTLVYTDASTGLTGVNAWSTADPYNYKRYFALQSTGLFINEDPFGGASWTLLASNTQMFGDPSRNGHFIAGSINRRGYFAIQSGNVFVYTTDYGVTWHRVAVGGAASYEVGIGGYALFSISARNSESSGWIYMFLEGVGNYKSEDWGATWALQHAYSGAGNEFFLGQPHIPYVRVDGSTPNTNDSAQEVYMTRPASNGTFIHFSNDAMVTHAEVYQHIGAGAYWVSAWSFTGWNIMTFTYDGSLFSQAGTDNFSNNALWIGIHSGGAATVITHTNLGPYGDGIYHHMNRYPVHKEAHLVWSRNTLDPNIHWTMDNGATWVSAAKPAGYGGVSYLEWNIADLIH